MREILQPPDILPTLLELAGAKVEPPEPFHGRSFGPLLRGRRQPPPHDMAIAASRLRTDADGQVPQKAVTPVVYTKRWAYARVGKTGRDELADLTSDPYAERNVIGRHRAVADRLHAALVEWLKQIDAPTETLAVYEKRRPTANPARCASGSPAPTRRPGGPTGPRRPRRS